MRRRKGRSVYSTESGSLCPRCGWPQKSCRCSSKLDEAIPDRIVARLRMEKAGRGGKTVTVIATLPRNRDFLKALASELKRLCGSGGKAGDNFVEVQGDHREAVRKHLRGKGWIVKG